MPSPMTTNIERAIVLAEESVAHSYGEARDELESMLVKVRAYNLLWERAHTVIATFEQLGKTRSVQEQMTLHRQCEAAMVSLKETLDATEETP